MEQLEKVYQAVREVIPEGELYAVGGCVRDAKIGIPSKDYDFCTNLTPDEMKPLIEKAERHVYSIGEKYGTLGFKVPVDDEYAYVEVTTYRTEKYSAGSRKPEVVFGTDLMEDLKRRDFTVNAMIYDGKEIKDYFAGCLDIFKKRIKPVGDPVTMIKDDPLRILRAIRFAVQLDFSIEQNLMRHMTKYCSKLFDVAIERQVTELDKMFEINPEKAMSLLQEIGYINLFLPELVVKLATSKTTKIPKLEELGEEYSADLVWKKILSKTGEKFTDGKLSNNNQARTRFLNDGICSRFKFSNSRRDIILGKK